MAGRSRLLAATILIAAVGLVALHAGRYDTPTALVEVVFLPLLLQLPTAICKMYIAKTLRCNKSRN